MTPPAAPAAAPRDTVPRPKPDDNREGAALAQQLVAEHGSLTKAAEATGVPRRSLQRWKAGARPREGSLERLRGLGRAPDPEEHEARIREYARRIATGEGIFGPRTPARSLAWLVAQQPSTPLN